MLGVADDSREMFYTASETTVTGLKGVVNVDSGTWIVKVSDILTAISPQH